MNKKDCSVVILAAGKSSRMGKPKFTLMLDNDNTFLEQIIKQYWEFGCTNIIVVLNSEGAEIIKKNPKNTLTKTQFVLNSHPEYGRYYSIKTGLIIAKNNYVFIHNVDNPNANKEVLQKLYKNRGTAEVIKPVTGGKGGHPVLISKQVIDFILQQKENNINFKDILKLFTSREVVMADESILININTNDEYVEFHRKQT